MKLEICWLSNTDLFKSKKESGTWINALAESIKNSDLDIRILNVRFGNDIESKYIDSEKICQLTLSKNYLIKSKNEIHYPDIFNEIKKYIRPIIYHVWGTESKWLNIAPTEKEIIKLLEIQGVKSEISKKYSSDLSILEIAKCTGIKEIIKFRTIPQIKNKYEKEFVSDFIEIKKYNAIATQTKWSRAQLKYISNDLQFVESHIALRKEFYNGKKWEPNKSNIIFTSAAYPAPFKGIHTLIRAIAKIKKTIPNIRLRIAGNLTGSGMREDGYIRWLKKEINRYNLKDNVQWIGSIDEHQIIKELQSCTAFVVTSFVESYCVALAEAMQIGTPTITTYTGGTSELATPEVDSLFYAPGDSAMLSEQVLKLTNSVDLQLHISNNAIKTSRMRKNLQSIVEHQFEIYQNLASNNIANFSGSSATSVDSGHEHRYEDRRPQA